MDPNFIRLNADPQAQIHAERARQTRAQMLRSGGAAIAVALRTLFARLIDAIRRARRRRQAIAALSDLSDQQLKDIGLRRSDIHNVADSLAKQPPDVGLRLAGIQTDEEAAAFDAVAAGDQSLAAARPTPHRPRPATQKALPTRPAKSAYDRAAKWGDRANSQPTNTYYARKGPPNDPVLETAQPLRLRGTAGRP